MKVSFSALWPQKSSASFTFLQIKRANVSDFGCMLHPNASILFILLWKAMLVQLFEQNAVKPQKKKLSLWRNSLFCYYLSLSHSARACTVTSNGHLSPLFWRESVESTGHSRKLIQIFLSWGIWHVIISFTSVSFHWKGLSVPVLEAGFHFHWLFCFLMNQIMLSRSIYQL